MTKLQPILVTLFLTCLFFTSNAQKGDGNFYAFDENFKAVTSLDVATYFLNVRKDADSIYVCRYYQKNGPMLKQETYKDKNLKVKHGRFIWYNVRGKVDSTGLFANGVKEGDFDCYNDTLGISDTYTYANGLLDCHKDRAHKIIYYANGKVEDLNAPVNTKDTSSKMFKIIQVESEYSGKQSAWAKFISKNFQIPALFEANLGRKGGGIAGVKLCFIVNTLGKVDDVWLLRSCEYTVDKEAFRVMRISPNWTPAIQNGQPVNSRKIQEISFSVDAL
jgi:antitoxin component YwqK of YwqJK toxin-antitoxin module